MTRRAVSLAVLAACLAGATPCRADDGPPAPAAPRERPASLPRARADAVRAALPAPTAADGFVFEADVLQGDLLFGHATYALAVGGTDAAPRWVATERSQVDGEPAKTILGTTAVLGRDLSLVRYDRSESREGGPARTTAVSWTDAGRLKVVRAGAGPDAVEEHDADRAAIGTFAGLFLLLRRLPTEPARYEVPIFVAATGATPGVPVEVMGPGRLDVAGRSFDTTLVTATIAGVRFEFHLGRLDRAPFAIRMPDRDVTILLHGSMVPTSPKPVDLSVPAASARDAAVRFVLGMLLRDRTVLERAIHAPSLLPAMKAQGYKGDAAGVADRLLEGLSSEGAPVRRQAEISAQAAVVRAVETPVGDAVELRLGAPMQGLVVKARAIDGAWLVVDVPERR